MAAALELAAGTAARLGAAAREYVAASTTSAASPTRTPRRSRRRPAARPSRARPDREVAEAAAEIGIDDGAVAAEL